MARTHLAPAALQGCGPVMPNRGAPEGALTLTYSRAELEKTTNTAFFSSKHPSTSELTGVIYHPEIFSSIIAAPGMADVCPHGPGCMGAHAHAADSALKTQRCTTEAAAYAGFNSVLDFSMPLNSSTQRGRRVLQTVMRLQMVSTSTLNLSSS